MSLYERSVSLTKTRHLPLTSLSLKMTYSSRNLSVSDVRTQYCVNERARSPGLSSSRINAGSSRLSTIALSASTSSVIVADMRNV